MWKLLKISLFLLLITTAGCTPKTGVITDQRPITLPDRFSRSGEHALTGQWWTEFEDDALDELIGNAFRENFTLLAARERLIQARAVARKAGANLSPTLDVTGAVDETWSRTDDTTTNSGDFSLGFKAGYEIDLWGRLQSLEDAALLDAETSREDLETAALSVAAQIADTWYSLTASNARLELLKKQQEINSLGLQLIQLRFNAGQVGIADILQQQQLIESKRGEQASETATGKVLQHQLALLSGRTPEHFDLPTTATLVELPELPGTGLPATLITRRPDLRSSYSELLAADRRVAAAVADRYPTLSLSANLNTYGTRSSDLFSNWLASIGANLLGPVIDGGSRKAEVDRTTAVAREKLNAYSQTILTAIGEVEDALIQEHQQEQYIDSLEVQLDLASRTLVNVRDRYKQGIEDYQRVLSALLSQQNLQLNLLTAKLKLIQYRIDLYRALGGNTIYPEEYSPHNDPL